MKNLIVVITAIIGLGFSSCTKDTDDSTGHQQHSFILENIMGEEVYSISDSETKSVNNNLYFPYKENIISGRYAAGSASGDISENLIGINLSLNYTFEDENDEGDFTDEMFKSLWYEGAEHKLGNADKEILESSILYVGVLDDNGKLQQYTTEINSSEDNSHVKVVSMEYNTTNSGVDSYKVNVVFESRMVNRNDKTDVLFLKDGNATIKVVNFSQVVK